MLVEKLALPKFEPRIIDEINSSRDFYNRIDNMDVMTTDKTQRKKKIVGDSIFDMFVGMFDLGYDLKLKFRNDSGDKDSIYVNINNSYDEIFYQIYLQCFCKYLSRIHLLKNNRIDNETYKIARMAVLNKDKSIIKKLADEVYKVLISTTEIETDVESERITQEEIETLCANEKIRVKALVDKVMNMDIDEKLSNGNIRRVFSCFSSNAFYKLDNKEKAHVANLLYNYFTTSEPCDNRKKYAKLFNKSVTNRRCLEIVMNDLLIPGNSMLIKKKNMDTMNNVLSGIPYINKNETNKSKLNAFDGLNQIIDRLKK